MSSPNPVPAPTTTPAPTPPSINAGTLGQRLLVALETDGSAPALALAQHLVAANGDIQLDIQAVEQFVAQMPILAPELLRDISNVLFTWELQRFVHFLGNHNILPATGAATPGA